MYKTLFLQGLMATVGILGCGIAFGWQGAVSAAFGGIACIVPGLVFVGFLRSVFAQPTGVRAMSFFVGEAIKIVLVLVLLGVAPLVFPALEWKALVIGLVLTLQANFLVLKAKA